MNKRSLCALMAVMLLCLTLSACAGSGNAAPTPTPDAVLTPPVPEEPEPTEASAPEETSEPSPSPDPTPTPVPLSILYEDSAVNSVTVRTGADFTLRVDTNGAEGEVTFSSDNESVASCDAAGHVTAIAEGTANITAVLGESRAVCKITVTSPARPTVTICFWNNPVYDFTMNAMSSETIQLRAVVSPADTDQPVVWSTADPAIATVSETGLVTALTEGTTKVICTCGEGRAECWVRVKGNRPAQVWAGDETDSTESAVVITYAGYISNDFTISVGESIDMDYKLYNASEGTVTWTIKDGSIASVDQNGLVTGLKVGTTELTVTCGSLTATCIVRVSKAS